MSLFIDEIIKEIKENKDDWICESHSCIHKDNVRICLFGNSRLLSVINVDINDKSTTTTYLDRWKLETALVWWFKNVSFNGISRI